MLDSASALPDGLSMRPARSSDEPFLASLYESARPDLQLIDADEELKHLIIQQQYQGLQTGAGTQYPNAMHLIIEKTASVIGALVVDFGPNEVRVVYLAFAPQARGHGYGRAVLQGMQQAATQAQAPLVAVVWRANPRARQHYMAQGFQVDQSEAAAERLIWYPGWPTAA